jgi:hypothetical protein
MLPPEKPDKHCFFLKEVSHSGNEFTKLSKRTKGSKLLPQNQYALYFSLTDDSLMHFQLSLETR